MSKRSGWLLGLAGLLLAGFLVACGTTYNPSSDGLVIVGSQGSALLQSFSFSLVNGHISSVNNPVVDTSNETCVLPGMPYNIVLDTAGQYAYAILQANQACTSTQTGIVSFKVNADGTLAAPSTVVADPNPVALAMDTSGKYLFVAEGLLGLVNTYAISSGNLTPVPSTFNFSLPQGFNTPNIVALAPTPTTLPALVNGVQTSACATGANNAPTNEFLYAADSINNVVYEFGVDMSTGALTNPTSHSSVEYWQTGTTPSGVAVDPCDRFVYVSNLQSNQISGFTLCSVASSSPTSNCPLADGTLNPIAGSPFTQTVGLGPGPLVVDPFGNHLYVLETRSNQVLHFTIASQTGALTAKTAASAGKGATSIAIRGDDNWLFVTNFTDATLSQYSIIPASGELSQLPAVQTDNEPWGLAVK